MFAERIRPPDDHGPTQGRQPYQPVGIRAAPNPRKDGNPTIGVGGERVLAARVSSVSSKAGRHLEMTAKRSHP